MDGRLLAWHEAGVGRDPASATASRRACSGTHPALGGGRLAVIDGAQIGVRSTSGASFRAIVPAPGADAVAVSSSWLAWRARDAAGDVIYAARAVRRRCAAR